MVTIKMPGSQVSELWRIVSDPEILSGKPIVRGMRIRVVDILENLAGGAARQEILADFPALEDGDITAALEFAALAASKSSATAA